MKHSRAVGRFVVACASTFFVACTCGSDATAPTPSPTPATPTAEATPTAPTTPTPPRAPTGPTPEQRAEVARLVREGRAAAHDERWNEALASFDRALAISPFAPRVLCEAGLVAHRAGHDAVAARRIDLALATFGRIDRLDPELRVPVAMCLYNRGLVAEADEDTEVARDSYERSLALRPNATVQHHLDALGADEGDVWNVSADERVDGVALEERFGLPFLRTTDLAALEQAIARGYGGSSDFAPEEGVHAAEVERLEHADLAWTELGVTGVTTFVADDDSTPLANRRLVLAFHHADGFAIAVASYGGYDNTDHGATSGDDASGLQLEGAALLVARYQSVQTSAVQLEDEQDEHPDWECYVDESDASISSSMAIVCGPREDAIECVELQLGHEEIEPRTRSFSCVDENGDLVEGRPTETTPIDPSTAWSLALAVEGTSITIATTRGTPTPDAAPAGTTTLESLMGEHALELLPPMSDAERAEWAEDYADEMGEY